MRKDRKKLGRGSLRFRLSRESLLAKVASDVGWVEFLRNPSASKCGRIANLKAP
jgi:hypothetical protein